MSHSGVLYDDPFHGAVLLAFDGNKLRKRGFEVHEVPGTRKCPRQLVCPMETLELLLGRTMGG